MKLDDGQRAEARRMKRRGMFIPEIAEYFGVSKGCIRLAVDPEYARQQRERLRKNKDKYKRQRARSKKKFRIEDEPLIEIPAHVKERWLSRAMEYASRTDVTAIICGDPLRDVCALYNRERR